MRHLQAYRDSNGLLRSFTDVGLYPLYYLDEEGNVLCPDCANKEGMSTEVVAAEVNWEDDSLYCDDCSKRIESAYAEEE